jgi:hypothetical protein
VRTKNSVKKNGSPKANSGVRQPDTRDGDAALKSFGDEDGYWIIAKKNAHCNIFISYFSIKCDVALSSTAYRSAHLFYPI